MHPLVLFKWIPYVLLQWSTNIVLSCCVCFIISLAHVTICYVYRGLKICLNSVTVALHKAILMVYFVCGLVEIQLMYGCYTGHFFFGDQAISLSDISESAKSLHQYTLIYEYFHTGIDMQHLSHNLSLSTPMLGLKALHCT